MRDHLRCTITFQLPKFLVQNSWRNVVSRVPPPPRNENCPRCWDFGFDLVQGTPTPENKNFARLRDFGFELLLLKPFQTRMHYSRMHTICCSSRLSCQEYTPYPITIENENLARLRDLVQSTPFPWKWKLGQIEGLWIWVGPEYPPPLKWKLGQIEGLWIWVVQSTPSLIMWELVCGD